MKFDLSPEGWGRVIVYTIAGTVLCVIGTLAIDSINFGLYDETALRRAILTDIFVPILLGAPLLLFFASKLRQLAIAHKQLTIYASTDSLTQVMNRGAFSALVDAALHEGRSDQALVQGALLVIDADDFKSVNDRFGHDRGDEALITIARAIEANLRASDLLGRLGGEEFGVFLPGATIEQAAIVAERIRQAVNEADFAPSGAPHRLTVSIGGAVFEKGLPFAELFRLADQQLYAAKQSGRNRVAIAPIRSGPIALVAAA